MFEFDLITFIRRTLCSVEKNASSTPWGCHFELFVSLRGILRDTSRPLGDLRRISPPDLHFLQIIIMTAPLKTVFPKIDDESFWRKRAPSESLGQSASTKILPVLRASTALDVGRNRTNSSPVPSSLSPTSSASSCDGNGNSSPRTASPRSQQTPRSRSNSPLTPRAAEKISIMNQHFSPDDTNVSEYSYRLVPIAELPARLRRSLPIEMPIGINFPYKDL
ncbi:hypothetical protein PROFUN_04329 [Planoprotostelium fungivorum]|uniref:Uncharacterized protein n=1 Tax=Planoprotostelium fungivorum TaxID=1890364 RepID=A0A2P6NV66_9EUKA|nr:hypothetical protein PROFUN_04329 [Planoprotostelium fungivorum]